MRKPAKIISAIRIATVDKNEYITEIIAEKIIEVENLVPTKEQLEAKAEEEANKTGQKKEELLRKNVRVYYNDLAYNALIDLLVSNAKLV